MLRKAKSFLFILLDYLQHSKVYKRFSAPKTKNIIYKNANKYNLENYSNWIYKKPSDRLKPIENQRRYIIAIDNQNNKIAGSVMLQENIFNSVKYCILYSLKTRTIYRNIGIGYKLTKLTIELSKKLGYKELFLSTSINNYKAINLYLKTGFKQIEYKALPSYYKQEIDLYKETKMIAFIFDN